ncbi:MAG: glycosyltransferase [Bacteroides thetaiotaomicron]|nr:glycosyltransferase [Bacteroides thetaiotaomicron]
MDYRVTTIIPVYNAEKYLEDTINSVIGQSVFKQVEVLLVDDGSTDCSSEICDRFSSTYENISVFHKKNGGVSSARNCGLSRAKGEYIHFMDADDVISPGMYETFLEFAEQQAHAPDVIVGG